MQAISADAAVAVSMKAPAAIKPAAFKVFIREFPNNIVIRETLSKLIGCVADSNSRLTAWKSKVTARGTALMGKDVNQREPHS